VAERPVASQEGLSSVKLVCYDFCGVVVFVWAVTSTGPSSSVSLLCAVMLLRL
jgi:hypothetical protein